MHIKDFEAELQKTVNPHLQCIANPKIEGLSGVYFKGHYLFAIPDHDIYDYPNPQYFIEHFDGRRLRHRTRPEALAKARHIIKQMTQDKDYFEAALGIGKYSPASLKSESSPAEEGQTS